MHKTIATMILVAAAGCAAAATDENGQEKTAATGTVEAASIPKDAVRKQDGTYSWTDKQGKQWIYRRTATGILRSPVDTVPASRLVAIPKDAVANPNGTYSWTDKEGKAWLLQNTPFGVMKVSAPAPPSATETVNTNIKVIDKGDHVRFERLTPFGVSSYEKLKSELNDDERRLYEASKAKTEEHE